MKPIAKIDPNEPSQRPTKAWRLNGITQQLHDAGSSPSEVARRAGVRPSTVSKVCKRESKSAPVQRIIEEILGKPWDEL